MNGRLDKPVMELNALSTDSLVVLVNISANRQQTSPNVSSFEFQSVLGAISTCATLDLVNWQELPHLTHRIGNHVQWIASHPVSFSPGACLNIGLANLPSSST